MRTIMTSAEDAPEPTFGFRTMTGDMNQWAQPDRDEGAGPSDGGGRRRSVVKAVAGWAAVVLVAAGLGAGAYVARNDIVRLWPPAALLYETVGLPVEPPGTGLTFLKVRSEQRIEDGVTVLVVEGQVLNISETERAVPRLRVLSIGPDRRPVGSWTVDPSSAQLLPGEIATFLSKQRDPGAVAEVTLTFDEG